MGANSPQSEPEDGWRMVTAQLELLREMVAHLVTLMSVTATIAFWAIPAEKKATLQSAYAEMAAVYELPSKTCKKFLQWRQGEAETPPTYCNALLALGEAAYPAVDRMALDSLVMERMLGLAWEMEVVLPVVDEDLQMFCWTARCLQAHEKLHRWSQMATPRKNPGAGDRGKREIACCGGPPLLVSVAAS
ncbi:unnamed protein product [Lampetra planeri]